MFIIPIPPTKSDIPAILARRTVNVLETVFAASAISV
jgi:hypothetical protein